MGLSKRFLISIYIYAMLSVEILGSEPSNSTDAEADKVEGMTPYKVNTTMYKAEVPWRQECPPGTVRSYGDTCIKPFEVPEDSNETENTTDNNLSEEDWRDTSSETRVYSISCTLFLGVLISFVIT